ncbi:Predicted lipid-binding transport protein, Tim44 family [Duganella sp. CF402]|uniref:Tim44 domain-containing protein n=1 Tax=unclassified Duganella TaxID=2636909 RepID=UPI0008CB8013|nr:MULTISPECIES: Tim44-like domain-containing protein [unclassified Duganella]RZT06108.1 putative lipid-binding transport protein (Tim44 family) [Duganella sp. BK701]SEM75695.1 Predicted lipid-binding transport protein, Tim44 family [Duganella sp. CF402]
MNLKKILVGAVIAVSAMSMLTEAIARPAGGGRSIGRQSQNVSRMPAQPAPQPAPRQAAPAPAPAQMPPAAAPKKPSMWKGILGGALLGLGLGALFSHFGMGGALASALGSILMLVLLAGVVFFIIRLIRGKSQPAAQPAGFSGNQNVYAMPQQGGVATPEIGSGLQPAPVAAVAAPVQHNQWGVPGDFDQASFLRVAKSNFIRLQAAWDKGDVADIREFTTPEVFAEMKMQITERTVADYTDVVSIDAELLGIETSDSDYLASVKFTGMIKPAPDALAEPFHEVWNLVKPVNGSSGWLLAGIQQLA